jgi:hypothetical protein
VEGNNESIPNHRARIRAIPRPRRAVAAADAVERLLSAWLCGVGLVLRPTRGRAGCGAAAAQWQLPEWVDAQCEFLSAERIIIMERTCSRCRFWNKQEHHTGWGDCRRRAPTPSHHGVTTDIRSLLGLIAWAVEEHVHIKHDENVGYIEGGESQYLAYWPSTANDDWCGEFEVKTDA